MQVAARAASRRRSISVTAALLVIAGAFWVYKNMEEHQAAESRLSSRSSLGSPLSALSAPAVITGAPPSMAGAAVPGTADERR